MIKTRLEANLPEPLAVAAKGKGYSALVARGRSIGGRYGLTTAKMDGALQLFVRVLKEHGCRATFPITASTLARHADLVEKYQAQNIEFAMHGLFHVDYSQLSLDEQVAHFEQARQIFQQHRIKLTGFRCPYLRWNHETITAFANNDLAYDSSQGLYWDGVKGSGAPDYEHVLAFYRAASAADYPALPKVIGDVVQIPYCLPDDEALIERLRLSDQQMMGDIWLAILDSTHQLGELFTLGLHPERIGFLHKPLDRTLAHARSLSPTVWIATLDEISLWWRARSKSAFQVTAEEDSVFRLMVHGPLDATVLARNVAIQSPVEPWIDGYERVLQTSFRFRSNKRPCVGLSPDSDPQLGDFLKQQGYWVETADDESAYAIYLRQPQFARQDEKSLLSRLAQGEEPLIRLGRWPNGARSAMCVTGDIDALTLWDYALRLFGR